MTRARQIFFDQPVRVTNAYNSAKDSLIADEQFTIEVGSYFATIRNSRLDSCIQVPIAHVLSFDPVLDDRPKGK